jgi:hypothetical protein
MRDGVNRAVEDGLQERRQRARDAAVETATREAQREAETRAKSEEKELAAMAEEDSKLMRATQKEYETAARERAVQSELEWQARSIGAKAADAARLAAVDALHMRSGALDLKAQAAHEAAAKVEAANAAKHAPAFAAAAAAKGQDLLGYDGLLVMGAAARAKAKLQRNELSESGEAVTTFDDTISAVRARQAGEMTRVIAETRSRREAQLEREIERATSQLSEKLVLLSPSQLTIVLDELATKAAKVATRGELEQCEAMRLMLEQRRESPADLLSNRSGRGTARGGSARGAIELQRARGMVNSALSSAAQRVKEAEQEARIKSQTPIQKKLFEEMGKKVHMLSGVFAGVDADGDGTLSIDEFRAVLPVLAVEGATVADAEALFMFLSHGAKQMGYRDLFLELTRQQRKPEPPAAAPAAAPAARPSSTAKERPGAPKKGGAKAGAAKKGGRGGSRASSAPRARGSPMGR